MPHLWYYEDAIAFNLSSVFFFGLTFLAILWSWSYPFFQLQLSKKILEYHESGYIEDLQELYFRRSKCSNNVFDGQLQGEASPMVFNQHAGLYLLLLVGIFVCILLMLLEHATFKWLVPYWRGKPIKSFWKSYSMLFVSQVRSVSWWRHQMEIFSALLAICAGNSPVTGEFPSQRPVTRSFDVFFDLRLNKQLSIQSRPRWFDTPSRSLWRHCNVGDTCFRW